MSFVLYGLGAALMCWSGYLVLSGQTYAAMDIAASLAGWGVFAIGLGAVTAAIKDLAHTVGGGARGRTTSPFSLRRLMSERRDDVLPIFVPRGKEPAHFEPSSAPTGAAATGPDGRAKPTRSAPAPAVAPSPQGGKSTDDASGEPARPGRKREERRAARLKAREERQQAPKPELKQVAGLPKATTDALGDALAAAIAPAVTAAPAKDVVAVPTVAARNAAPEIALTHEPRPVPPAADRPVAAPAAPGPKAEAATKLASDVQVAGRAAAPPANPEAEPEPEPEPQTALEVAAAAPVAAGASAKEEAQDGPVGAAAPVRSTQPEKPAAAVPPLVADPPAAPEPSRAVADTQVPESQVPEPKAHEPKAPEPKAQEPKTPEPKVPEWLARARARRQARLETDHEDGRGPGSTARPDPASEPDPEPSFQPIFRPDPPVASEPEPEPEPRFDPEQESGPTVVREGEHNGVVYRFYDDGSVEAESPHGVRRFASVDDLRSTVLAARGDDYEDFEGSEEPFPEDAEVRYEPGAGDQPQPAHKREPDAQSDHAEDPLDAALAELEGRPAPEVRLDPHDRSRGA